jgi:CheY-like chemotaxis protein
VDGRGLGLFVASTTVKQHGGRIEVESTEGDGTCFTVYWPLAHEPDLVSSPTGPGKPLCARDLFESIATVSKSPAVPQVLLVDDEREWVEIIQRCLESPHYAIRSTSDVDDAINLLQSNRHSLVLLDWEIPKEGGLRVLKSIQKSQLDTPVIILSAHTSDEQRIRALELGAWDVIPKPYRKKQWDKLKNTIREHCLKDTYNDFQ